MKKLYLISSLAVGILLTTFALHPRLQPRVHLPGHVDFPEAVADINSPNSGAIATQVSNEFTPCSVAARMLRHSAASDTQRLINTILSALQSGDNATWNHTSQNELAQLIKLNPQAAADLAQNLEPGFAREQMLRQVAHGWAEQNPAAALTWAAGLSDADDRTASLADVCRQISQTDPAAAIADAMQYGLDRQPGLLQSMAQPWAVKDLSAALGWADQLPASIERNQVMTRLAFVESQISPQDAAKIVVYEIPSGSEQEEAALSVLHQWALKDFASATAWANQFGDTPFHARAEQELDGINRQSKNLNN